MKFEKTLTKIKKQLYRQTLIFVPAWFKFSEYLIYKIYKHQNSFFVAKYLTRYLVCHC